MEVSCPTATRGFMGTRVLLAAVVAAVEARVAKRMYEVDERPSGGWRRRKRRILKKRT